MKVALPPRRSSARPSGFTLVEVLVAMAVIAVAFTAMLGLHVRSLKLAAREQLYTQSLLLARSLVTDYELDPPPIGSSSGDFEARFPGKYPGFRWELNVQQAFFPKTSQLSVRVVPVSDPRAAAELMIFLRQKSA